MARTMLLIRYGFCTGLGLAVIGLAAASAPGFSADLPSTAPSDSTS